MRNRVCTVVLLSALLAGCHGPMNSGFYQSPYLSNGVDGPGPGVVPSGMMPPYQPVSLTAPGMMPPGSMNRPAAPTSQVNFIGEESLVIRYDARVPGRFDSAPLVCPATHDFGQGAVYRLKLSNIPGYQGKELYPTLEIAPTAARTQAFLAHSAIPVMFSVTDFDQVFDGNFVTKVIYLPNPEFQGIAMSGVGELVSTHLPAGADPIVEASKRGAILAVIRMGNKDFSNRQPPVGPAYMGGGMMSPAPGLGSMPPNVIPHNVIAGVNAPHYGVPMTKTTTGVPGPPQLPQDMYYAPNRSPVLRTEPMPAPPTPRTLAVPGQPIPGPVVQ